MKLCMIGTGYVGLVSGVCFSDIGNTVYCVDKDKRKIESLSYLVDNETSFMEDWSEKDFNNYFIVNTKSDTHPPIIVSFLRKDISLETIVCMNSLLSFFKQYDKVFTDPIYQEVRDLCKKYEPFLRIEKNKISKIIQKKLKK